MKERRSYFMSTTHSREVDMFSRADVRWLARLGFALLLAVVVYAVVGTLLSLATVNGQKDSGGDVVVYLVDRGVHTDIVVPTKTERIDWSKVAPP